MTILASLHFRAGQVTRSQAGQNTPLKLFNPTPTTQVVASLFYVRENEGQGDSSFEGDDEGGADFHGCRVSVLRPHSAVQINLDFLGKGRTYTEIISAPLVLSDAHNHSIKSENPKKSKKSKKSSKRILDGLGIGATATVTNFASVPLSLIHPSLFSLPSDSEAELCVCYELFFTGVPDTEVFEDFGISCDGPGSGG